MCNHRLPQLANLLTYCGQWILIAFCKICSNINKQLNTVILIKEINILEYLVII